MVYNKIENGKRIHENIMKGKYSLAVPKEHIRTYKRDKKVYITSLLFIVIFLVCGICLFSYACIFESDLSYSRYIKSLHYSNVFILLSVIAYYITIYDNRYKYRRIMYSDISDKEFDTAYQYITQEHKNYNIVSIRCMYCYLNEKYVNMNCDAAPVSIIKIGSALVILSLIISFNTLLVVQLIFLL